MVSQSHFRYESRVSRSSASGYSHGAEGRGVGCMLRSSTMPTTSRDLLELALQLPRAERARIAAELLESLSEAEEGAEAAWINEIKSRVASVRADEIESTDWRVVLERVEKD